MRIYFTGRRRLALRLLKITRQSNTKVTKKILFLLLDIVLDILNRIGNTFYNDLIRNTDEKPR